MSASFTLSCLPFALRRSASLFSVRLEPCTVHLFFFPLYSLPFMTLHREPCAVRRFHS
jgi:hypothetical protein